MIVLQSGAKKEMMVNNVSGLFGQIEVVGPGEEVLVVHSIRFADSLNISRRSPC